MIYIYVLFGLSEVVPRETRRVASQSCEIEIDCVEKSNKNCRSFFLILSPPASVNRSSRMLRLARPLTLASRSALAQRGLATSAVQSAPRLATLPLQRTAFRAGASFDMGQSKRWASTMEPVGESQTCFHSEISSESEEKDKRNDKSIFG